MRFPVKINRKCWPALLSKLLPAANDVLELLSNRNDHAAFSEAMGAIKIDGIFKTTESARYPLMIDTLKNLQFANPPIILDVAASDGSAALSTLQKLNYKRYYITDRNPTIFWTFHKDCYFFYDLAGRVFMAATNKFVYYEDTAGAPWPIEQWANNTIRKAPVFSKNECEKLVLINPAVDTMDDRITVQRHDLFDTWTGEQPELIIAANILNFNYFDKPVLINAIKSLLNTLNGQGYLAVVDNRPDEHGSLFSVTNNKIRLERSINSGAQTESLVLELANH